MLIIRTFIILFSFIMLSIKPGLAQDSIPGDFCIHEEEYRLYEMINEYRKAMNLSEIPLSNSLSFVARTHALDLAENRPDTNTCNFHSWSDKGQWKACCFVGDIRDRSCMLNKPKEFTLYPGVGYEVVYWESRDATAARAFDQWRETNASRSMITNFKEWEKRSWNALGVGIYKGFAIAWFGEKPDVEPRTTVCETGEVILNKPAPVVSQGPVINHETGRFYVIVAGFSSFEDAKARLKRIHNDGHKAAKIISKDDRYRVSIADYDSMEDANKAKREYASRFKDAWVLAF
ncbi:MAG: SPOR domain-containing protein [Bacteroidales bacterium]